jgi:voltage-gated potassium channel Kch
MNDAGSRSPRAYFLTLFTAVGSVALLGAVGFHAAERGVNLHVRSFADSLWWSMVTMTTIGYGDVYPVTPWGRLIALVLMFLGIGTLGVSTAAIAAYFVQGDPLQRLRLGRLQDHVVICGLSRASLLLARAFSEQGHTVVVVERSAGN